HARITKVMTTAKIPHERQSSADEHYEVPKVSVLVACVSGSDVSRTVKTALAQTYTDLEVCVGLWDRDQRAERDLDTMVASGRLFVERAPNDSPLELLDAAVQRSRGEYGLILEPGDELREDCVMRMASDLDRHPHV